MTAPETSPESTSAPTPSPTAAPEGTVRVRFCPSPTGTPHVGLVRTALFNWAHARRHGGDFVFRIEDTDAARDSEESYAAIIDALRWLGLDWDEGPEVGGPHGPYRQSQRGDIYAKVIQQLLDAGEAYEAYSTAEEVEERHRAAGRDPKLGYDNFDRTLTEEQKAAYRAEGREPVIRLRMPDTDLAWDDLVRGRVEFSAGQVPDFVIARSNGKPLYTLVNPVDDALMGITHVLRGEDLLSSTPRQLALYAALERIGVASYTPVFGHLPFVMGEGNKKLSKRDPESDLFVHRDRGFLPEGLLNYLALLGWNLNAEGNEVFTLDEMVAAFDASEVNSNPARFDQKKADAINAEHIRHLDLDDFSARLEAYLREHPLRETTEVVEADEATEDGDAGHVLCTLPEFTTEEERRRFRFLAELLQTRIVVLGDAWKLCSFLYVAPEDFRVNAQAAKKNIKADAGEVLAASIDALEALSESEWVTASIEAALHRVLIEERELKPRKAYAPLRVGVTGGPVSPPLFESFELLGREETLRRLRHAQDLVPVPAE